MSQVGKMLIMEISPLHESMVLEINISELGADFVLKVL